MDGRILFKLLVTVIFLAAICLAGAEAAFAQKGGTAAKGGSFRLERARSSRGTEIKNQPMYYRSVVRALEADIPEIDFPGLEEIYDSAGVKGLKFETVIKAFIAAKQHSPESGEDALRADCINIIKSLGAGGSNLSRALQRVFPSLTREAAKEAERAADASYERARRAARLRP